MDDNVTVRIVGDASGVQPAVQTTESSLGGLEGIIANINGWVDGLISKFVGLGAAGGEAGGAIAKGMAGAVAATEAEGSALTGMILKVHEGAEAVRTFQMRAKEFAEVYVAAFAVEAIAHWAESLGEAAEKMEHLSAITGMSIGQVQGLQGAAQMSGVSMDTLTKALGQMDNKALQSTASTSSVTKAFHAVGVSANDGATNMDRLLKIADKFHDMADGPTKAALAMQLFGKSGRDMIPLLNQGSAAIEQLMEKSKELGEVNEAAVEQGARLATSVNEAKVAWEGLKNILTQAFGPILTELVDGFIELVAAMKQSYDSGGIVKVIFDGISEAIQGVIEIVHDVALGLDQLFQDTGSAGEDWGALIKEVIDGIVLGFKILIAINVYVVDAFIAAWDLIKAAGLEAAAAYHAVVGSFQISGTALGTFMQVVGKVVWDALHLDWGSIAADWDNGMAHVKDAVQQKTDEILAITGHLRQQATSDFNAAMNMGKSWEQFREKLFNDNYAPKHDNFKFKFGGGDGNPPDLSAPGPKGKKGKDTLVQELEAELEAKKTAWAAEQDAQGTFQQYSLQSEADFWAEALKRTDLSTKDKLEIEKKYLSARQALKKEEIQDQLDKYAQEIEAAGANWDKKIKILQEEQAYVAKMYGAESHEAKKAAEAVVKAEQEKAKQVLELNQEILKAKEEDALADVEMAEQNANFEVEMGRKSKSQLLAQDKQFENERYQIKLKALNDSLRLMELDPNTSPVKLQQIYSQIEQLYRQHEAKLTQIDQQAVLQRTLIERQGIDQISQSWSQSIGKMLTGQQTFRSGLVEMWQGLVQAIGSAISSIVQKFIAGELTKLIFGKTTAQQQIVAESAKAGAGGVASMAAAPFPMDLTAPAFGASMAAAAMSFSAVNVAEKGDWNVKEGLYHLHDRETVLPAWAATGLRDMVERGSKPSARDPTRASAQGGDFHMHYAPTIHHRNSSLRQELRSDGRDMRKWAGRAFRNGSIPNLSAA